MGKKRFKHLIVVGHPDKNSFCYNGIYKTIVDKMDENGENYKVIDLYEDKLHRDRTELIKEYQDMIAMQTIKQNPEIQDSAQYFERKLEMDD